MPTDDRSCAPRSRPRERRFLIEIEEWDASLFVGRSPLSPPKEYCFQGGLIYVRSLDLGGRVLAPKSHHGKTIRIWISSPLRLTPAETDADLIRAPGSFHFRVENPDIADLSATLHLPEDGLPLAVAGLNSNWKFLEFRVSGRSADYVKINAYSFAGQAPEDLVTAPAAP